jgi:hypothetical protein
MLSQLLILSRYLWILEELHPGLIPDPKEWLLLQLCQNCL